MNYDHEDHLGENLFFFQLFIGKPQFRQLSITRNYNVIVILEIII